MTRRNDLRAWVRALDHFELSPPDAGTPGFLAQIAYARNAFVARAAAGYTLSGSLPNHPLADHRGRLADLLAAHYRRVVPYFGSFALRGVKSRPVRVEFKRRLFADLAAEWIARESLRKAAMVADTDADDVRGAIDRGFADGLGTAEIASNIRKVSRLTPFRAATVARTETHAAATFGSIEAVRGAEQELGVKMLKEWGPTLDDRTRDAHAAMANQPPIGTDEKFVVGGELMDRPGDPSASPANLINCRCTLFYSEDNV